ncbi:MAG: hypothetical protein ACREQW_21725 [Candidatus Binatia bacterium]
MSEFVYTGHGAKTNRKRKGTVRAIDEATTRSMIEFGDTVIESISLLPLRQQART